MPSLLDELGAGGPSTTAPPAGGLLGGAGAPPPLPTPGGAVFGGTGAPVVPKAAASSGGHGGLGGLLPEAFHLVASLPQATFNLGKASIEGQSQQIEHLLHGDWKGGLNPYTNPALKQVVEGFPQTGGRLVDFLSSVAPGGEKPSESQYGKAFHEGHLVGALTQDLANVSIVGSLAAKPLGAAAEAAEAGQAAAQASAEEAGKVAEQAAEAERTARLETHGDPSPIANARVLQTSQAAAQAAARAEELAQAATEAATRGARLRSIADAVESVGKGTGKAANAPFLPIDIASKGLGALGSKAATLGEEGAAAGGVADRIAHPAQAIGDLARGVGKAKDRAAQTVIARNLIRSGKLEGDKLLGPIREANVARARVLAGPVEEGAHALLMGGEAHATVGPYEQLHAYGQPEHAAAYVHEMAGRLGVAPEALQHAYDTLDPTLQTPEMEASRARLGQAEDIYRGQALPVLQGEHLAGRDVPGGIANPAQLEQAQRDVHATTAYGDTPEERLDPANAPARYRPILQAGHAATEVLDQMAAAAEAKAPGSGFGFTQLKQDAITTLQEAVDAGLDPAHVIGGGITGSGLGGRKGVELPQLRDTGATRFKKGASQPRTIREQHAVMARRAHLIAQNAAVRLIQESLGKTAVEVLGDDAAGARGAVLAREMRSKGFTAWDPVSPLAKIPDAQVTAATSFIPSGVHGTFRSHFNEYRPENLSNRFLRGAVKTSDLGNKAFRVGVLYLSPRWLLGHTVGHTVLDLASGMNPFEVPHYWNQARQVLAGHAEEAGLTDAGRSLLSPTGAAPESLLRRGMVANDLRGEQFTPGPVESRGFAGGLGHGVAHPIETSQRITAASDDINRVAIALAKTDKGLTDAEATAFVHEHPNLKNLDRQALTNEWAVRESLRVAGDMSNMTAIERDVVSRVVLFYPWMKHITRLTFELALHDPTRVAWTMYLANQYGPKTNQFPITQGKWDLGHDWYANLPKLNPFDAPFNYFGATGSGTTPLASLNPILSLAARGAGFNTSKLAGVSQPAGFAPMNAYGSEQSTGFNLGALERGLLGLSPQASAFATALPALGGHEPVVRYESGQPVRVGHQDIGTDPLFGGNVLGPLLNLAGVGASKIDVKAIAAREAELRAQAAAARKSYGRVKPGRAP